MGLPKPLTTQDAPLSYQSRTPAPQDGETIEPGHFDDDGDPLAAARGIVIAMALGSVIWAVILWALL